MQGMLSNQNKPKKKPDDKPKEKTAREKAIEFAKNVPKPKQRKGIERKVEE